MRVFLVRVRVAAVARYKKICIDIENEQAIEGKYQAVLIEIKSGTGIDGRYDVVLVSSNEALCSRSRSGDGDICI